MFLEQFYGFLISASLSKLRGSNMEKDKEGFSAEEAQAIDESISKMNETKEFITSHPSIKINDTNPNKSCYMIPVSMCTFRGSYFEKLKLIIYLESGTRYQYCEFRDCEFKIIGKKIPDHYIFQYCIFSESCKFDESENESGISIYGSPLVSVGIEEVHGK